MVFYHTKYPSFSLAQIILGVIIYFVVHFEGILHLPIAKILQGSVSNRISSETLWWFDQFLDQKCSFWGIFIIMEVS